MSISHIILIHTTRPPFFLLFIVRAYPTRTYHYSFVLARVLLGVCTKLVCSLKWSSYLFSTGKRENLESFNPNKCQWPIIFGGRGLWLCFVEIAKMSLSSCGSWWLSTQNSQGSHQCLGEGKDFRTEVESSMSKGRV